VKIYKNGELFMVQPVHLRGIPCAGAN